MAMDRIGIIMHGVTGRMGYNQHLVRSILAIRDQGGIELAIGKRLQVDPIIVGRNAEKMEQLAEAARHRALVDRPRRGAGQSRRHHLLRRRHHADARRAAVQGARRRQAHLLREADLRRPRRSPSTLAKKARASGLKHGVVQDKLFLPGLKKLAMLRDFGLLRPHALGALRVRLLGVRGRLGRRRRSGRRGTTARATAAASSSTCSATGATCIDSLFGEVKSVSCLGATHIPERIDENGQALQAATPTTPPTPPSSSRTA